MLRHRVLGGIAAAGCLAAAIGFFLPWGPGGPVFTSGFTTMAWGARISNTADQPVSLGAGVLLMPGETLTMGPRMSGKIIAADGKTRLIFGAKLYGGDVRPWGHLTLVLGLAGAAIAVVGAAWRPALPVRILLPAVSGLGIVLLAVKVVRDLAPVISEGESLTTALEIFAPFGEVQFCTGMVLAAIGFLVALVVSLLLGRGATPQPAG